MDSSAGVDGKRVTVMLWVGAGLVTAGAAAAYWPAGLVVAGVLIMRLGSLEAMRRSSMRQRVVEGPGATKKSPLSTQPVMRP